MLPLSGGAAVYTFPTIIRFYDPVPPRAPLAEAELFLDTLHLDGQPLRFRLVVSDKSKPAIEIEGRLRDFHERLMERSTLGYDVYLVANETANGVTGKGGTAQDCDVTGVRTLFVDGDGVPLPERWHVEPSVIIRRDNRWWAFWRVRGVALGEFRDLQHRLVLHYGTDKSVCNLARIVRLPGYTHHKSGRRYVVTSAAGGISEGMDHDFLLPELPPIRAGAGIGEPVTLGMARDMLTCIRDAVRAVWVAIGGALYDAQIVVDG